MGFTGWQWDDIQQEYYYFDPDQNSCVYKNRTIVPPELEKDTKESDYKEAGAQHYEPHESTPKNLNSSPISGKQSEWNGDRSLTNEFSKISIRSENRPVVNAHPEKGHIREDSGASIITGSVDASRHESTTQEHNQSIHASYATAPMISQSMLRPSVPAFTYSKHAAIGGQQNNSGHLPLGAYPSQQVYSGFRRDQTQDAHQGLAPYDQEWAPYGQGWAPYGQQGGYQQAPLQQPQYQNQPSGFTAYDNPRANIYSPNQGVEATPSLNMRNCSDDEVLEQVGRNLVMQPTLHPELQKLGINVPPHRVLRGTPTERERLDDNFKILKPGYKYFKPGLVFRVLWPELAGDINDQNMTLVTTSRFENEKIFAKIRWFVVVREGNDCCTCLSIQTYSRRGVPENKVKDHHAIMYTGNKPPAPLEGEQPRGAWELPMGPPIRIIGKKPWDKMLPSSRVNFLKIYTIEHNVKVHEFGNVASDDHWKFISQFHSHWSISADSPLHPATRPTAPRISAATMMPQQSYQPSHPAHLDRGSVGWPQSGNQDLTSDWASTHQMPDIAEDSVAGYDNRDNNTLQESSNLTYGGIGASFGQHPTQNITTQLHSAQPNTALQYVFQQYTLDQYPQSLPQGPLLLNSIEQAQTSATGGLSVSTVVQYTTEGNDHEENLGITIEPEDPCEDEVASAMDVEDYPPPSIPGPPTATRPSDGSSHQRKKSSGELHRPSGHRRKK
ncbi:hypothetical protein CC78DRAFT_576699 [Lojkania enalia]|uniref:DUF6590 domain-containing protein n=1 Tax=Lojkania enalia TaxID=147567 RepID=A0A9P4KHA8_9PLEO|nr:hypothetical protein CC78DRAFT_576699 [Didymosphaeria enalia]